MAKCADNSTKKHDDEEHCFYMTQHVATLPYRAPELLFVLPEHSTAVDMWAVGCIFGEMIIRNELLPGRSVQGQIKMLITMLGQPPQDVCHCLQLKNDSWCTYRSLMKFGVTVPESWFKTMGKRWTPSGMILCIARPEGTSRSSVTTAMSSISWSSCSNMTQRSAWISEVLSATHTSGEFCQHSQLSPSAHSRYQFDLIAETVLFKLQVKHDMMYVEDLSHSALIDTMCKDVRSAENTYREIHSGGKYHSTVWLQLTH